MVVLSSTSSSTHDHNHIYDVFLSFRGVDTRNRFTDHLYNALLDAGIKTFLDDEEIRTGEPLKSELEDAIESSRASIVILSKNYAFSTWCLDELVLILEQKRKFNQIVIPIFYDVEPTDVRTQQSTFRDAMAYHKMRMETDINADKRNHWAHKIDVWKRTLTEVANLKGKVAKGRKEAEFIKEIINDIHYILRLPSSNTMPHLIGMDHYINTISSWLVDGSCHTVDILTIAGMSGIGKTSLAQYVFQLHSSKFHNNIFIGDINRRCSTQFNLLSNLKKQLSGQLLKNSSLQVHDVNVETCCKKVLLILDDVDCLNQLDALLENKAFNPGSKIIITTNNLSLTERCALFNHLDHPKHTRILLRGLNEIASLQLLCLHAFKCKDAIMEGYEDVSRKLVKYCEGHPLALEFFGISLRKRDVAYLEDCIKGLKKEPHSHIKKALQMSFDSLPFKNDKDLFKHIACFFVGTDRDMTETILNACDINTRSGITNLIDRCLLSIGWDNKLMMHQLVQEMGRDLVRQESPDKPWKRSRLWCHEETFRVLKQKKGKGNLLGLSVDMRILNTKKLHRSFEVKIDSLSKMDNLMLLQLNYVQVSESFKNFPEELRWLCMHGFPLRSISLDIPMENLVALDMSYSNIESFDMSYSHPQPQVKRQKLFGSCSKDKRLLGSLKILDLSFCEQLHSLGGFYELPSLERLIVRNCTSLIEVCESIEQCVELVLIDFGYCYKLERLPKSIRKLKKVKTILLDGCNSCESQMEMSDMNSSYININSTITDAIASDLKYLTFSLPSSLRILSLADNNLSNESFPIDFSCLSMLEDLCLDKNPIVSMPNCVRTLRRLERLSMDYCDKMISIEHPPHTLRVLSVGCHSLRDSSLRKIKFDPKMSPLERFIAGRELIPHSSYEIDGMVKFQAMTGVEEKILHSSSRINLEGLQKSQNQMCYEFGIFSTMHEEKGMPSWISCKSKGPAISFTIPSSPKKLRGISFCCVQMHPHKYFELPTIKISNTTTNHSWIYYNYLQDIKLCGNFLSLLSYWKFVPNEMKAGDHITITLTERLSGSDQLTWECGIGVVFDDGKHEKDDSLGSLLLN